VVARRRLREPHVAGIARQLPAFERCGDGVAVDDLPARRVHQIGAALHPADHRRVEQILGFGMERRVDRHHVAMRHHVRGAFVERHAELLFHLQR